MSCKVIRRVFDRMFWAGLVVQEAELKSRLRLRFFHRGLLVAQVQYLHQVLDSLACIPCLGEGLCEELVPLDLLRPIPSLLTEIKEELALLNRAIELTLSLIDHTNLLIALSLDITVLGFLCHS